MVSSLIRGIDLSTLSAQLETPPVTDKVLLLDGDFGVYAAAATCKRLDTAIRRFYTWVLEQCFYANVKECLVYLTPTGCAKCGRYLLPTVRPYQAQRTTRPELPLKQPLKQHLLSNPNEYSQHGIEVLGSYEYEADDLIVMDSYRFGERCIISSGDKDLRLSPYARLEMPSGTILGRVPVDYGYIAWDESHSFPIVGQGTKFFFAQMLAGDAADNIKGILTLNGKPCGATKAFEVINPIATAEEAAERVLGAYATIGQDVLAEAEALWLRRHEQDSAYEYLMSLVTTPEYRSWLTQLRDYHEQYRTYILEQSNEETTETISP